MTRFWDGRTDGQSDCTPRPAFAFGDAGKSNMDVSLRGVQCKGTLDICFALKSWKEYLLLFTYLITLGKDVTFPANYKI